MEYGTAAAAGKALRLDSSPYPQSVVRPGMPGCAAPPAQVSRAYFFMAAASTPVSPHRGAGVPPARPKPRPLRRGEGPPATPISAWAATRAGCPRHRDSGVPPAPTAELNYFPSSPGCFRRKVENDFLRRNQISFPCGGLTRRSPRRRVTPGAKADRAPTDCAGIVTSRLPRKPHRSRSAGPRRRSRARSGWRIRGHD